MRGEFLKLRRGKWTFRMRVPSDLKAQLGSEITRDLGTSNARDAERAARRYASDLKGVFAALRAGATLGPAGDARALVRRIADGYVAKLQKTIDDDLAEEVGWDRSDEIADAYGDAELHLTEQVEEGDYGDLVAGALKDIPRGVVIDQDSMKAIAASIVRGLAKLSFDPDRERASGVAVGPQSPQRALTVPTAAEPQQAATGASKPLGEGLALYLKEQLASGKWENSQIQYHVYCREFVASVITSKAAIDDRLITGHTEPSGTSFSGEWISSPLPGAARRFFPSSASSKGRTSRRERGAGAGQAWP